MHQNPFALFRQFPELTIELCTKSDGIQKNRIAGRFCDLPFAIPRQVHGSRTIRVGAPMMFSEDADGIVTGIPALTLAILTADCQSFAVFAPKQRVIGLLHAGWRGLLAGAIPSFFETLRREWSADLAETFVAAGPSLCQACSEFTDPARELPGIDHRFFQGRCVDLRGIADAEFDRLGVPHTQRERHPDCTRCRNDLHWSYRGPDRERVREGFENMLTIQLHTQSDR